MNNPIFSNDYLYPIAILVALMISLWFDRDQFWKFKITRLDIVVFVFFFFIAINTAVFKLIPLNSSDFYFPASYACIYLLVRRLSSTLSNPVKPVIYLMMLIGFFECVTGIYQFFGAVASNHGAFKVTGSFVSPALFSIFLVSVLPFAIYHCLTKTVKIAFRIASLLLSVLIVINIFLFTDSRASWMAVLVILSAIAYLERRNYSFRFSKNQLFALAGLCISGLVLLMIFKKDSTSGRWFVLQNTLNLIKDHPFTGIGLNNFDKYYNDYQASVFASQSGSAYRLLASYVTVSYNDYLQFWLGGGLFALIILVAAVVSIFRLMKRIEAFNFIQSAAAISVVTIAFLAFFSFPFQMSAVAANLTVSLGIIACMDTSRLLSFNFKALLPKYIVTGFACILILRMLITYNAIIRLELVNSISGSKTSSAEQANLLYGNLWSELHHNNDYLEAYGQAMYTKGDFSKASEVLTYAAKSSSKYDLFLMLGAVNEKTGNFKAAEKYYIKCNDLIPSFFTAKYRLMILYLKHRKTAAAKTLAKTILDSPVKVHAKMVGFIRAEAGKVLEK